MSEIDIPSARMFASDIRGAHDISNAEKRRAAELICELCDTVEHLKLLVPSPVMTDRTQAALKWWQDECVILRFGISDALQLKPNAMRLALQRLRRESSERQRARAEAVLASREPQREPTQ